MIITLVFEKNANFSTKIEKKLKIVIVTSGFGYQNVKKMLSHASNPGHPGHR
jgi:hypothetical protein